MSQNDPKFEGEKTALFNWGVGGWGGLCHAVALFNPFFIFFPEACDMMFADVCSQTESFSPAKEPPKKRAANALTAAGLADHFDRSLFFFDVSIEIFSEIFTAFHVRQRRVEIDDSGCSSRWLRSLELQ